MEFVGFSSIVYSYFTNSVLLLQIAFYFYFDELSIQPCALRWIFGRIIILVVYLEGLESTLYSFRVNSTVPEFLLWFRSARCTRRGNEKKERDLLLIT